ncbi:MAG: lasso peptide biosynthesis B2 protein, partial [Acidimicrobiia bacterium]
CLRRTIALAWLLRRRGIATTLRIGVTREGGDLVAHSWLQSEEGELFGLSETETYALLSPPTHPEPVRAGSER